MRRPLCFVAFLLVAALPAVMLAQEATGRIVGTVTDPSEAVIRDATVTVTNADTKVSRVTSTDQDGSFQVLNLPIGPYTVTVERAGFATTSTAPQELRINQSVRVDVRLQLGQSTQTVLVEAAGIGVETVDSSLGGSVTSSTIVNMPLNGRNVMDLIGLQAGATPQRLDGALAGNAYSISGGRTDSVTFLLDGTVNNNLLSNTLVLNPNPDMIEEFRVITSNGSAEYGRNAGGIVTAVVKSGTNAVHGSAYDYLRNDAFNANRFFFNAQGRDRPILKRNQFGGMIGGPVVIPKIINGRDRLFFSFGYQGQRQNGVLTGSAMTVFTPEQLNGDFSGGGTPDPGVADFLLSHPYFQSNPGLASQGIIDPAKISSVAKNFIQAGLIPSSPSGVVYPQGPQTVNNDEITSKVDLNISKNDRLAFTLGASRAPTTVPFSLTGYSSTTPGLPYFNKTLNYLASIAYTKIFSPNLLNELHLGAQRNNALQGVPVNTLPTPAALGMAITPDLAVGPPLLSFYSGLTVGAPGQGPTSLVSNTYNFSDTVSWTRGRHTIKAGFNTTIFQNNMLYDFLGNGGFDFYGPYGSASGNDLADFLLGLPDDFFQYPNAPTNVRTKSYAAFAQDELRLTPRLVLTFGLRYEYSQPKRDTNGRTFSLALGKQSSVFSNAPAGLLFPGDPGAPNGANFPDRNDFAPRFGVAWSPGDGKTSIRGGFGIYYDILKGEDNLQFNGQAPFFSSVYFGLPGLESDPTSAPNQLSDPYAAAGRTNPFPSKPPTKDLDFSPFLPFGGNGVYVVNPHLRTPYVYQYNVTVQRELLRNLALQVSYVGNTSRKLTGQVDANPFVLGTTTRLFGDNFNYLNEFANVGEGNYNSVQAMLEKRLGEVKAIGSVDFKLSYTYGHAIDTSSGFRESNIGLVPSYNPTLFRASGDEDIRHNLVLSGNWELPLDRAWSEGPKRLTKGWSLRPILTWHTGFPLDVLAGFPQQIDSIGPSGAGDTAVVRPNLVGSSVALFNPKPVQTLNGVSGNYWFNPANFSTDGLTEPDSVYVNNPARRTYGTLGRNAFRGPGRTNLDLGIGKDTSLWRDSVSCQFRVEAFNLLNHAQWTAPDTNILSSVFGQVTDTYDPRIIQLSLRFQF